MVSSRELLREYRTDDLWQKSCGFIELDIEQFMAIQEQLLLEQIELLKKCELGKKLLNGAKPGNIKEFRKQVPLTIYDDYMPYLPERTETSLLEKPLLWQRTSGRSSEYSNKWVPVTKRMYRELGDLFMALLMFSSCNEKKDVCLEEGDKFLYALAPPPRFAGG